MAGKLIEQFAVRKHGSGRVQKLCKSMEDAEAYCASQPYRCRGLYIEVIEVAA